ncbi:hypothetical protein HanPSC8_Chr14g0641211 [Helianthus annuus]|nr:hypothetical protein HanPSC8_Chr14g0641211 [Helianthus annuus]
MCSFFILVFCVRYFDCTTLTERISTKFVTKEAGHVEALKLST